MDVPSGYEPFPEQGPFRTRVERVGGRLSFADCSLTVDGREIVRSRAVWVVVA